eukprot:TRINITY_DN1521_c0_g1_i1.p2 TRINITY_DN1521_c0_g1~~TRINITY_DN1521_c0_g1_i1.p2  ORF type:complete len:422 (-),score=146.50 TRINITY_DN1521_c0_g1_i1:2084-3208(-)
MKEGPKIKTMSTADLKIKGKVIPLEQVIAVKAAEREEQRQRRKEAIAKKKQEAKEAGEEKKPAAKPKRDTSDTIKYPKGSNCHHCRANPGKAGVMIECEEMSCEMKFCRKCLTGKYGLQISDPHDEEKEEEESKSLESLDSDDSMVDEDRVIEKPGVMNTGNTRWKCPVCENICICQKCLKSRGLPQVTHEDLKDIHKAIKNKFPNVWTYLIYTRDHPNGTGDNNEEDEAEDEESGETTNNNNNNNSNRKKNNNNNNAMEEDSTEEIFQKPKRKAATEKKEKKEKKTPEKKPKKAKKNVIEEEEFIVEAILDKRKRKGVVEYHIKWAGYGDESNTWEVESNLNCPALVKKFEDRVEKSAESESESSGSGDAEFD